MNEQQLSNVGVAIHAGFPNAAIGSHTKTLDITKLLIKHPATTFMMRIDNNAWSNYGIFQGDIAIVDRSANPSKQDIVIWCEEDSFILSKLKDTPSGEPIWGTVTSVIHQYVK